MNKKKHEWNVKERERKKKMMITNQVSEITLISIWSQTLAQSDFSFHIPKKKKNKQTNKQTNTNKQRKKNETQKKKKQKKE